MLSAKEETILSALEPQAQKEGLEVVTVEIVGSRKAPTIRVYLDKPEGITFDDITEAQVWINELMDEMDPFPGAYTLEVSSPGIDRPLRTPEHFNRFAGEEVRLTAAQPSGAKSRFDATLAGFDQARDEVLIEMDGTTRAIPYKDIKKAHVKGRVDFG